MTDHLQPKLDAYQQQHQVRMHELLRQAVGNSVDGLPFDRFMELALYAPGLGYYVAGAQKFGAAGDFVTAPELSSFFSRCLAHQCAQILAVLEQGSVLEFGAGRGIMAADILLELERQDCLPRHYLILELSPELRQRQCQTIKARAAHLLDRVQWLDGLPHDFTGVMLANEVLDAMPVSVFRVDAETGVQEKWVRWRDDGLQAHWQPALPRLRQAVEALQQRLGAFPAGYVSEVNLRLRPWLQALADSLAQGVLLVIDYGYLEAEYYHPQRHMGTLLAHFRHRAYDQVLQLPGLQDITASVDFSAVERAARQVGLTVAGYSNQASFLMACGLQELLAELDPADAERFLPEMQKVKQLILPSEMGERFKVMALSRNLHTALLGFRSPAV